MWGLTLQALQRKGQGAPSKGEDTLVHYTVSFRHASITYWDLSQSLLLLTKKKSEKEMLLFFYFYF